MKQIQLSKNRIEIMVQYLTEEKKIDKERFISKATSGPISDFVMFRGMQVGDEF